MLIARAGYVTFYYSALLSIFLEIFAFPYLLFLICFSLFLFSRFICASVSRSREHLYVTYVKIVKVDMKVAYM